MPVRVVAVTGAGGFIGNHLICRLATEPTLEGRPVGREQLAGRARLQRALECAHVVVHLAALNRAPDDELYRTNVELVERLIEATTEVTPPPHLIFASSTQRGTDTAYGRSKLEGERLLEAWSRSTSAPVTILEIPNVFGPGSRPFYNSVVATFAHQVARSEEPEVRVDRELELVHVSDLVNTIADCARSSAPGLHRPSIEPVYRRSVSELLDDFTTFARSLKQNIVPPLRTRLDHLLYGTLLSHLEPSGLHHDLESHSDPRGSLVEVVRHELGGQVFFSTTRPGVVRGNHFHTSKFEKFCVIEGEAVIRLRRVGQTDVLEIRVSGDAPQVVEIPPYHVHNIENVGKGDLLTLFWANELFDPSTPDTFAEEV